MVVERIVEVSWFHSQRGSMFPVKPQAANLDTAEGSKRNIQKAHEIVIVPTQGTGQLGNKELSDAGLIAAEWLTRGKTHKLHCGKSSGRN